MFRVSGIAARCGARARQKSAPYAKMPFRYGDEVDAILSACRDVQAEPWNEDAAIRLIRLAGSILNYHDSPPGSDDEPARLERMNALICIVRSDLGDVEAIEVAALVPDLISDTPQAESAALKLKPILLKLGKVGYDVAVKIITDVASEVVKKTIGLP